MRKKDEHASIAVWGIHTIHADGLKLHMCTSFNGTSVAN